MHSRSVSDEKKLEHRSKHYRLVCTKPEDQSPCQKTIKRLTKETNRLLQHTITTKKKTIIIKGAINFDPGSCLLK